MWIVIAVFLAVLLPIVFYYEKRARQSHKAFSRGVMNHNAGFTEFAFETDKTMDEIRRILASREQASPLNYRLGEDERTVVFCPELPDGSAEITYHLALTVHNGRSILMVTEETQPLAKNRFACYQNEFWYKTVGAVPYPYIRLPSRRRDPGGA